MTEKTTILITFCAFAVFAGWKLLRDSRSASTPSKREAPALPVSNTTFQDIAGYGPIKESLGFLVNCLKDPEQLGSAVMPHGIMLAGPPGTGKTMFARAIAGEVNVPFYAVNASQFTDRLVGQGARNVRALYAKARQSPVSIVFIDEIDAIGCARGQGENTEERQTLNALLSELDGFKKSDSFVLTIAATNTYDELDPALVRAGRFDRKLVIPLPTQEDREAILASVMAGKRFSDEVSVPALAVMTPGFSGAKLVNFINEAAICAASHARSVITNEDLDVAFSRILTNGEPVLLTDPVERRSSAIHEAGHAIVARMVAHESVPKTTIVGSTSGFSGWTYHVKEGGGTVTTRSQLEESIMVDLAGRIAESIAGYEANSGAESDITIAVDKIKNYFITYGFGDSPLVHRISGSSGPEVTEAAKALAKELSDRTAVFLAKHKTVLLKVTDALCEKNTLTQQELDNIIKEGELENG